jgi:hypothetical protein
MPHHGLFVAALVLTALATAFAINLTHDHRFRRAVYGIKYDISRPDAFSVATVAVSVSVLAILGIYTVMFLPLDP